MYSPIWKKIICAKIAHVLRYLISLKFQVLYNLINVLTKISNEFFFFLVSYHFVILMGPIKWKCDVFNNATQGYFCLWT